MRHLILFLLLFCGLSFSSYAQGYLLTSLYAPNPTLSNCDQLVTIDVFNGNIGNSSADYLVLLSGGTFVPSTLTATVNWGDGSFTSHTGYAASIGSAMQWNPPLQHTYANTGNYNIAITITNPQNGSSVLTQLFYLYGGCPGTISAIVQLDCDNNGVPESSTLNNVPLNFSGPNGFNTSSSTVNGFAIGSTNAVNGTYTVNVNQTWLSNNNYVVSNASDLQMNISNTTSSDTAVVILNCAGSGGNNLCISGTAFCDANSNAIFDAGESVFANVPLTITNNGTNYLVYTNANGFYNLNYTGTAGSPTIVAVNSLWMSQNNCTTQSFATTVLAANCGTPNTLNVPFICTTCSTTSMCAAVFVFCDANGNNYSDNGESPLTNVPISIYSAGNNNPITVYTDTTGFAVICGNYFTSTSVYAQINPQWYQQNGYTGNTVPVQLYPSNTPIPPTAIIPVNCSNSNNACDDLWTTVTPWIGYYQNTTATIRLNFGNYGPGTATTYTLSLSYPVGVTPILGSISIPGYSISGNTITWNLTNAATGYSFTDFIQFSLPSGLTNGAQHYFTSTITATGSNTDCNYANNTGTLLQILGNSYDPNDKTVNQPEQMSPVVTDNLTYTIRFQNTGTAPAQNIHILDTLSANLDWNTFEVLYASHPMNVVDLGNGIKKFEFPQIWLPDSTTNEPESHGQIVYRIRENVTNGQGEEIFNTAYIYFDWNPAIITNTTYNINAMLMLNEISDAYEVYPNPAQETFTIKAPFEMEWMALHDMSGKQVLQYDIKGNLKVVPVSEIEKGLYILSVKTSTGISSSKLMVH